MKKIYIEPKNVVVRINSERVMCLSRDDKTDAVVQSSSDRSNNYFNGGDGYARETVSAPDAWDEW